MVPAGGGRWHDGCASLLQPGDIVIDGGNSHYIDDIRRARAPGRANPLPRRRCQRRRLGRRSRLLPDDWRRRPQTVTRLEPIFKTLAPGVEAAPATPGAAGDQHRRSGLSALRPSGAGHFVKMVHNGIEYALMGAYRGLQPARARQRRRAGATATPRRRRCAIPSTTIRLRRCRRSPNSGGVEAWSDRGCSISPRARWPNIRTSSRLPAACPIPVKAGGPPGRHRKFVAGAHPDRRAVPAVQLAARDDWANRLLSAMRHQFGGHVEPPGERKANPSPGRRARPVRRHRRSRVPTDLPRPAGDESRGHLHVPVICVARQGWTLDGLRARMRKSLADHGGSDSRVRQSWPRDCTTSKATTRGRHLRPTARGARAAAERPVFYLAIPTQPVRGGRDRTGAIGLRRHARVDRRKTVRSRSGVGARAQRDAPRVVCRRHHLSHRSLPRQRAGAEPALFSLRQYVPRADLGIAHHVERVQITMAEAFGVRAGAISTRRSARSATCSRITCCRFSRCWRWMARGRRWPRRSKRRRWRCCRPSGRSDRPTWCAVSSRLSRRSRASRRTRRSRPTSPRSWRSRIRDGRACRSRFARASAWPRR